MVSISSLDFDFEVITSDVDESSDITEPSALVCELSRRKALAVRDAMHDNNRIIIACDTVVALNDQILGKPVDEADARNMLRDLSDDMHSVYSGLCIVKGNILFTEHFVHKTCSHFGEKSFQIFVKTLPCFILFYDDLLHISLFI